MAGHVELTDKMIGKRRGKRPHVKPSSIIYLYYSLFNNTISISEPITVAARSKT
jgi:hypothetical protein